MPDWRKSMTQTFEYYKVDPGTWKDVKRLDSVKSCSITRDLSAETLGSASFDMTEDPGEIYVRVYLLTNQNGVDERFPLGTFLTSTPGGSFDGMVNSFSVDAYTSLMELKENPPELGYYSPKSKNVLATAYDIAVDHTRAPVVEPSSEDIIYENFVANGDDTWLSYLEDLISNANYTFDIDELGRILFAPKQDTSSLQPVWTFTDDNSSILLPSISYDRDLYGIPNVVEVVYSTDKDNIVVRAVNDNENSPTSIQRRGREILSRISNPEFKGIPNQKMVQEYADQQLASVSTLEYSISYSHAYCPVRIYDCVRLNYVRANLTDIKARVTRQTITCDSGCSVDETATYTQKLWK